MNVFVLLLILTTVASAHGDDSSYYGYGDDDSGDWFIAFFIILLVLLLLGLCASAWTWGVDDPYHGYAPYDYHYYYNRHLAPYGSRYYDPRWAGGNGTQRRHHVDVDINRSSEKQQQPARVFDEYARASSSSSSLSRQQSPGYKFV